MCEKCRELDKQIAELRKELQSAADELTRESCREQISDLIDQKIDLHAKPAGPPT